MMIERDALHSAASQRLETGFAAELTLGLAATATLLLGGALLLAAGQHAFGVALLALAPWLPFLLVQDFWRWVGFMRAEPGRSLANDSVFNCAQALSFVVFVVGGIRSPVVAIAAWGIGALAGSLFGLWQFGIRPTGYGGTRLLRSRWRMSRWLAATALTSWGSSQSYIVLAGGILGPVGLGGLKAAQSLVVGPSFVLVQAGGSIGLPEASRALAERGWPGLRRVAWIVSEAGVLSVGLIGGIVVIFGKTLLGLFYGPQFTHFASAASLIAIAYVISAIGLGPILALKATRQTRSLFRIQAVALAVSIITVLLFSLRWGVVGAAAAAVLTGAASLIGQLNAYVRTARAHAKRTEVDDDRGTGQQANASWERPDVSRVPVVIESAVRRSRLTRAGYER
jgi:O-antigen/teichoic acid export membrane protein